MTYSVAIVPARRGSVAFPNKNMSLVNGKSLIEHAVLTARDSNIFDFIIISTDYYPSELGFELEKNEIFHIRSEFSASATANASDVLSDFRSCEECAQILEESMVCYLQPTSPLRMHTDITASRLLANTNSLKRCVSLNSKSIIPKKLMSLNAERAILSETQAGDASSNRQENSTFYLPNGAIYWFMYKDFLQSGIFPVEGAAPYLMSEINSIDVDRVEDLEQVQLIMEARNE